MDRAKGRPRVTAAISNQSVHREGRPRVVGTGDGAESDVGDEFHQLVGAGVGAEGADRGRGVAATRVSAPTHPATSETFI
jgi:hypothetical protein